MTAHGHFYWNELMTRDAEKAKAFYGQTLGWTFEGMEMPDAGTYWLCTEGEDRVGGIFTMSGPAFDGAPEMWMSYLAVDDVDARVAKARDAGATIAKEPWDVPGVGRIATVQDPGGAMLGWMTPAPQK
ncbi:VOC family protein [Aurantimonas marianensis]|uniref:VOC family protein n=1 Tax=Aurantimonas marianensis TaxID=2920428 RepID=A0A9X2H9D1_9HYPH|nr:VOC family protein [Aurantimonas marianensis]MCP3056188.1 VOC family protein [Aurantimonas marianensis]